MCRILLVLVLLAAAPLEAEEGKAAKAAKAAKAVKPISVTTKKKADTQLFITSKPAGARVQVDDKDAGTSPKLFVVPAGVTRMTVVVELDGYAKDQQIVEIRGGRIERVTFDLRKQPATAGSRATSTTKAAKAMKAAPAPVESDRAIALRFGKALAAADNKTLREFWTLDDPIDRAAADVVLTAVRQVQWAGKPAPRIELVRSERIRDTLTACYYAEGLPLFGTDASPIFLTFSRKDGTWKTPPIPGLRNMAQAMESEPGQFGRRMMVRKLIDLRFGSGTVQDRIAHMRAQMLAFRALSESPYNLSMFESVVEGHEKEAKRYEMLAGLSYPEIEELILTDQTEGDVGSPDDFYLAFYLEAGPGKTVRSIPRADKDGDFTCERIPSLTGEEVKQATVDKSGEARDILSVRLQLTDFGKKVFGRLTKASIGKKLAIVVDGKVVSAPKIMSEIAGTEALITGQFTLEEAETIARHLNAHQTKCRAFLEKISKDLKVRLDDAPERPASK